MLDGGWCTDDQGGDIERESYEFEFARSGGSVFFSDGVDIQVRGPITSASERGRDIYLSMRLGTQVSTIHLRRLPSSSSLTSVGAWTVNDRPVDTTLSKCGEAKPATVARLSWASARSLSVSDDGGSVTFAQPRADGGDPCMPNGSYLNFDLIGPSNYYAWRTSPEQDAFWHVISARDKGDAVRISGHADSGDVTLMVRWRDKSHIVVEPWGETFVRCSN